MTPLSAAELVERCRGAGIILKMTDGGRLVAQAPETPEAEELLNAVVEEKEAVRKAVFDPRTDLPDTPLWQKLMQRASTTYGEEVGGVFEGLHAVRCCGAQLVQSAPNRWKIEPGEWYVGDWSVDRAIALVPHKTAVTDLLAWLGRDALASPQRL